MVPNDCGGGFTPTITSNKQEKKRNKKDVDVIKIMFNLQKKKNASVFARLLEEEEEPHPLTGQDALIPSRAMRLQTACKQPAKSVQTERFCPSAVETHDIAAQC